VSSSSLYKKFKNFLDVRIWYIDYCLFHIRFIFVCSLQIYIFGNDVSKKIYIADVEEELYIRHSQLNEEILRVDYDCLHSVGNPSTSIVTVCDEGDRLPEAFLSVTLTEGRLGGIAGAAFLLQHFSN